MPDELWMEVHSIVQDIGIKTIPKKNKCKKAKWVSEEALQIAVKRQERKVRENERYTQGKQVSLEWTETSGGLWEWWHDPGVPLAFPVESASS